MATQEHRRKGGRADSEALHLGHRDDRGYFAANMLGAKAYHRFDATKNERFTLSRPAVVA